MTCGETFTGHTHSSSRRALMATWVWWLRLIHFFSSCIRSYIKKKITKNEINL